MESREELGETRVPEVLRPEALGPVARPARGVVAPATEGGDALLVERARRPDEEATRRGSADVGVALEERGAGHRGDLAAARLNLDSNDVTLRFWRNQTRPAVDLQLNYGAQGVGGTQFIRQGTGLGSTVIGTIPGGYTDALSLLGGRDFPTWNAALTVSYPLGGNNADGQYARTRVLRTQQTTRLRALELQVATEVTNAAIQVQANLRRVDASRAARALAERRLEAEQSKFEVGLSTNFFVVQAQRDLADAQNVELRALTDLQRALVTFERAQEAPAGGGGAGAGAGGGN